MKAWKKFLLLFLFFFPVRFVFGVVSEFWFEDEIQIYLIGLKFYTSGNWPFFGPDVVYTNSQLSGALQGILVGLPFFLIQIPEAPYILLNLITFLSLYFLGYYIIRYRVINFPEWFLWTWIFTAPWVMNHSTHIYNPSYVLPATILFFISFFESIPVLKKGMINLYTSVFLMGFSLLWIFQLHMSWVLMLPFIAITFIFILLYERKMLFIYVIFFLSGCLISGALIIPTYLKYGSAASGDTASNIVFNIANTKEFFTVLFRLLSLGSFDVTKFMGASTNARLSFLSENLWAAPFIIFAIIIGIAQVAWIIISWFRKSIFKEWKAMKTLILFAFLLTYVSFFFSIKGPSSHTLYIMFPLILIYSVYCWQYILKIKLFKIIAVIFLFSNIVFHTALGLQNYQNKSMYVNRDKPLKAIQQKNYHILGERRFYDRNK